MIKENKISKKKFVLITLLTLLTIASLLLVGLYIKNRSELNKQVTTIDNQLKELPELEKDIFTKCMEGKDPTAQSIAKCQENTQKQMHTLAQDLTSAKKDLQNKKWYEVLKS